MKACYCRFILAVLVIVFAWLPVSWANIALTVIGGLLAILALTGGWCCCCAKAGEEKAGSAPPEKA